jgi:hypothetical protein
MSRESGGSSGREGFQFQDWMAAYYFVAYSNDSMSGTPQTLHIERDRSDFHFRIEEDDLTQVHCFESKLRSGGQLTWSNFCTDILPNFAEIAEENTDEGWVLYLHTVTNVGFQGKLNTLLDDVEKFRKGSISWSAIKSRHDRMFQRISNEIDRDPDSEVFSTLVWGLSKHRRNKEQLELSLLEFLRKCSSTRARAGREMIMKMISEKDHGVISREELESEISFDLTPRSDSTNWNRGGSELRKGADELQNTFSSSDSHVSEYMEQRIQIQRYAEHVSSQSEADEEIIASHSGRVESEFDKLIEAEKTTSAAQSNISDSIEAIQEYDDQTDSERDND